MLDLGFLQLRLYGILVTGGIVAAAWVSTQVARKFQIDPDDVWDALPWLVIPGVIGARIYHVVDLWSYYQQNLGLIPQVWTGGLGIFGGIAGGVLGLWLFARRNKQSFVAWLDIFAVGAPLGQAIGRWGNFFNQELYGRPFDFAQGRPPFWAIEIDLQNRLPGYEQFSRFHPLFLYESLWSLVTFLVLLGLVRRRKGMPSLGTLFTLYILFYSLGRFYLEGFKINPWVVQLGNSLVPTAQLISGILILGSVVALAKVNRK